MSMFGITWVDSLIIVWYFIILLIIGFSFYSRTHTESELFLAGRRLTWPAIGFSLFATNISSTTMIGLAGSAYVYGVAVSSYEWMATLVLIFGVLFIFPFYFHHRISTIPEFLEKRFNVAIRRYVSMFTILLSVVIDIAASLYAGALLIAIFLPGTNIWITCFVLAVLAGLYTAGGGLAAVVYTDILQAVLIIMAGTILSFAVFSQYDFSWTAATDGLQELHLQIFRPAHDSFLPWTGIVLGLPLLSFYVWIINQYIVQRILGAKNINHARWGALFGASLKLLVLFIMVIPGLMAINLLPKLDNPDMVFPTLVKELLPPGVLGIMLAGVLAAIMSSLDSALNSASTLIVIDLIKPLRPHLESKQLARIGKSITLGLMIFAGVWAPFISYFSGLFDYVQIALAYLIPPVVTVFLAGIFLPGTHGRSALWTMVSGHFFSGIFIILTLNDILKVHYTLITFLLFLISCFSIFILNHLLSPGQDEPKDLTALTWIHRPQVKENSGHRLYDHKLLSIIILCLLLLTVWKFL